MRDANGAVIAAVVALRDMTEQRHQQEQLRAMSMSDDMTRLHNRRSFSMLAEQHARVAHRHKLPVFDPEQPLSLTELMVEADRLMYADKREQRLVRG